MIAARNLSSIGFAQNILNTSFVSRCLRTSVKGKYSCPCVFLSTSHGNFLILRLFLSALVYPLQTCAFLIRHYRNYLPVCSGNCACSLPFFPHVAWPSVSRSCVFIINDLSALSVSSKLGDIYFF